MLTSFTNKTGHETSEYGFNEVDIFLTSELMHSWIHLMAFKLLPCDVYDKVKLVSNTFGKLICIFRGISSTCLVFIKYPISEINVVGYGINL